jgi:hypothetical protein
MTPSAATGRIVWADIPDPNGIRKLRPAIIVTPGEQILAGGPLTVVAITSRLSEPFPRIMFCCRGINNDTRAPA